MLEYLAAFNPARWLSLGFFPLENNQLLHQSSNQTAALGSREVSIWLQAQDINVPRLLRSPLLPNATFFFLAPQGGR